MSANPSPKTDAEPLRAEIIAIGDELITGVRVDTNSQWIAQRLGRLGIHVACHVTVGDDLADMRGVMETAASRADVIITTGGLGPTADDLTRNAIADLAGVELQVNDKALERIRQMYRRRGREMPPNNEVQALFPAGATIIENPEGTAPGIEIVGEIETAGAPHAFRLMAFPGVPAELKQMWTHSVHERIKRVYSISATTMHHTVHCFGAGESAIEMELSDLVARGRDPLVGITASAATVSLRIATRAADEAACRAKIEPTLTAIRQRLGDLVFGENGRQLEEVVVEQLICRGQTIGVFDWGLSGDVASKLARVDNQGNCLRVSRTLGQKVSDGPFSMTEKLDQITADVAWHANASLVLVVGPVDRDEQRVEQGLSHFEIGFAEKTETTWNQQVAKFRFSGHSAWRETRAVKDVLNAIRLLQ